MRQATLLNICWSYSQSGSDDQYEWDLARGRIWCTVEDLVASQAVIRGLEREQEVVTKVLGDKDTINKLMSLMNAVHKQW